MHLAVDVRDACDPHRTGKGCWTYGFVSELLQRDVQLTLCTNAPLPSEWMPRAGAHTQLSHTKRGMRWHTAIAQRLFPAPPTFYVSPTSYIIPALFGRRLRCVPIIHDLIAFHGERHQRRAALIERMTLGRACSGAAHVCTVSNTTKADLLARYPSLPPERITTILAGPTAPSAPAAAPDGSTILCVGTLCPRKNQRNLIRAFATLDKSLRSSHRLVLVGGRGWDDAEIIALAAGTPNVSWLQYVPNEQLSALYRTATIFALPSFYEGFGLPILDAMQHGLPVLTSRRGSLQEIAGDAALLVEPDSIPTITAGLERLLRDAQLRATLAEKSRERAATFSWSATVDTFLAALSTHA